MQESSLTEIKPFICISAIWGQYPVFFTFPSPAAPPPSPPTSQLLSAHCREWLKPYGFQIADTVFLPGCPPGSEIHIWSARMADDCGILAY